MHTVVVEEGRLRQFARATADRRPEYADPAAARDAGLPGLRVPATFLFCLEMERDEPWAFLDGIGVPRDGVLHGEQFFRYHRPVFSGESVTFTSQIGDVHTKSGGRLQVITRDTVVTGQAGEAVAELRCTLMAPAAGLGSVRTPAVPFSVPAAEESPDGLVSTHRVPPVSRATLALYAGASGDHNPIHIDLDAAREAGLDDVIGHGMLTMAYAAQGLADLVPGDGLIGYEMRFLNPVRVGDALTVTVRRDGEPAGLDLRVADASGQPKARGRALSRPDA
jgi:acyl dehydratase